jgi:hypothetical protein
MILAMVGLSFCQTKAGLVVFEIWLNRLEINSLFFSCMMKTNRAKEEF